MPMVRLNVESTSSCSAYISSKSNVSCQGANDGSAVVTAGGCAAPYEFEWSNGILNDTVTGLAPGTYTVTVIDANASIFETSVTITEPELIALTAVITEESGNNTKDGKVNLSITGGTPAYKYIWSNGAETQDVEGLNFGSYTVTVTDANDCVSSKTFVVDNLLGVDNVLKSTINIYPNPTNGKVNISNVENSEISVFNIIGEKVMIMNSSVKNFVLDMNNLSEGTYIIKVIKEGNVIVEKITLKK